MGPFFAMYGLTAVLSTALFSVLTSFLFLTLAGWILTNFRSINWSEVPRKFFLALNLLLIYLMVSLACVWFGIYTYEFSYESLFKYIKKLVFLWTLIVVMSHTPRLTASTGQAWFSGMMVGLSIVALYGFLVKTGLVALMLGPEELNGGWNIGSSGKSHSLIWLGGYSSPTVGRNYITLGYISALVLAYWGGVSSWAQMKNTLRYFMIALMLWVYISTVLTGRTALVLGVILISFLVLINLRHALRLVQGPKRLHFAVLASVSLCALLTILIYKSPAVERLYASFDLMTTPHLNEFSEPNLRLIYIIESMRAFLDKPFLGHGFGSFNWIMGESNLGLHLGSKHAHPHSELLFALTSGGLVYLLMWLYFAFSVRENLSLEFRPVLLVIFFGFLINPIIYDFIDGYISVVTLAVIVALSKSMRSKSCSV